MKIQKQKSHTLNKATLLLLIVAALLVIWLGIAYATSSWPFKSAPVKDAVDKNGSSLEISGEENASDAENAQEKQDFLDDQAKEYEEDTKNEQSDSPTPSSEISLAAEAKGEKLIITTKLPSISSGKCSLTLTKGQQTVTRSANIIYSPEYSSCAGFSVDKSELSSGDWTIELVVNTSSQRYEKTIQYKL